MGAGLFFEPALVVFLLLGGCWVNRNTKYSSNFRKWSQRWSQLPIDEEAASKSLDKPRSGQSSPRRLSDINPEAQYVSRTIGIGPFKTTVLSPNTKVFEDRWLSQLIHHFPFIVEVFYWALIYWVYQLGRAFSAVTLVEGTVSVARRHALELIHLEKSLNIFWEIEIQAFFLQYPYLMSWINSIYSFIHIPGTILFLIWLFWYTETSVMVQENGTADAINTMSQAALYEARRRTMAFCNLLAFIVFTIWPCMPPRLLSDPDGKGEMGIEARSYGFIDTVHGNGGQGSVWTQNKFCNQYAAMPSLHFGYSLLIGMTIMTIPLKSSSKNVVGWGKKVNLRGTTFHVHLPWTQRALCVAIGILYPLIILVAIVATANHFILDAVAGAMVCGIAWKCNDVLLNLLPLQDWFLSLLRVHFPGGLAAFSYKV